MPRPVEPGPMSSTGRVALITGAGRGQGRAHAVTLARAGVDVVALDIADDIATIPYPLASKDDLDETVRLVQEQGCRAIGLQADVRFADQVDSAVAAALDAFGRVDILIANAGVWAVTPFWQLTEQQWDDMLATNLSGVWRSVKAVTPHMIDRGSGAIVMTASVNGLEPGANYAHYVTAKHGVIGLMKNVALELAPYGIRCNAICPGAVDTGMTNWQDSYDMYAGHVGGTRADLVAGGNRFHALRDAGVLSAQAMADAAAWLVSDAASSITGVALPVDAGHLILTGVNPHA